MDHIDGVKTNNHISNLRWVSSSTNMKNLNGHGDLFEFVDKLPEDAVEVEFYSGHEL